METETPIKEEEEDHLEETIHREEEEIRQEVAIPLEEAEEDTILMEEVETIHTGETDQDPTTAPASSQPTRFFGATRETDQFSKARWVKDLLATIHIAILREM